MDESERENFSTSKGINQVFKGEIGLGTVIESRSSLLVVDLRPTRNKDEMYLVSKGINMGTEDDFYERGSRVGSR